MDNRCEGIKKIMLKTMKPSETEEEEAKAEGNG